MELFKNIENCGVVNIGGISNLTLFSPELMGYDCGCGNVLPWIYGLERLRV